MTVSCTIVGILQVLVPLLTCEKNHVIVALPIVIFINLFIIGLE